MTVRGSSAALVLFGALLFFAARELLDDFALREALDDFVLELPPFALADLLPVFASVCA
jgi:hypothetical protein